MQRSSLVLFCEECGLANNSAATHCCACQRPLARASHSANAPEIAPVAVTPAPVREVAPGLLFTSGEIYRGTLLAECYLIKEEIGRGGFSIVYRAVEVDEPDRQVAIKRIPLNALTPGQVIDATDTFNRELAMLTRFTDTPGVPRFYGHLVDQANWYLIMEYIEGETLEERLQKAPGGYLDEAKVIEIGIKLAQIFYSLHSDWPPVIFRDVKPANIMLTSEGELYLIDFGIARDFKLGKVRDTTPLGSPGYAAPEQYGRSQTDRRADIYGLGVTLQTLVTGRDPLELQSGEPPRNPRPVSPELRTLLDAMLAPEAAQRPSDMYAVQTRLESIQEAQAHPDSSNRQFLMALGLLVAVLIFAFIYALSNWLGFVALVNLGLSAASYSKWSEKQQIVGHRVITIGRIIATLVWLLLPVLGLVVLAWQLLSK